MGVAPPRRGPRPRGRLRFARRVVIATWTDPRWLDEAHGWVRDHVAPAGPIEQPHLRPWSTVLRVPTAEGTLFFKANAPATRHEAVMLEVLARRAPGFLPELVALDGDRGWLLLRDAGTRLRERPSAASWAAVLDQYADLQAAAAPSADALVAAGVPDRRLAVLPELYERLGGDRDVADELCEQLRAFGLPETIQHDDLHDGQVFLRDGHMRLLDWGDACVSHPFMTLAITAGIAGDDAVDAYLARWGDSARLRTAVAPAQRLAGVTRALQWRAVLADAPRQ